MLEYLLFMLMCTHWLVPKLLAGKIIIHTYYINLNARPWWSMVLPFVGIMSCYILSLFLEFILGCTAFLLSQGYYGPTVLQVLWWIYFLDLICDASLHYHAVPIITYMYCLISTAWVAAKSNNMVIVASVILTFNLVLIFSDLLIALGNIRANQHRIYKTHLSLLYILYFTTIFHTATIDIKF